MGDLVIPIIDAFRGEYRFFSNFALAPTPHRGRLFSTSEHAMPRRKPTTLGHRRPFGLHRRQLRLRASDSRSR
jgi:hypothetical protein